MAPDVFQAIVAKSGEFNTITLANTEINVDSLTSNATANVTISNVAPAAVGTATISAWLAINVGGTLYYIPCWT